MFTLEDNDIAIIGDVHQDTEWIVKSMKSLARSHPHINTYIQLGDFGLGRGEAGASFLKKVNKTLRILDKRMFVLLGNHDDYDKYATATLCDVYPGTLKFKEAPHINFFERQAWFKANGLSFLTVVGANSINRQFLNPETVKYGSVRMMKSWWKEEQITEDDVLNAISQGEVDIFLCHDTPRQGFPLTEEEAAVGHEFAGMTAVAYAEVSSEQLQRVLEAVNPSKVFHGHYHKRLTTVTNVSNEKGHSVTFESLGMNRDKTGNIIILKEDSSVEPYTID